MPTWPLLPLGPVKPTALNSSNWAAAAPPSAPAHKREMTKYAGALSPSLSHRISEDASSGAFHCGGRSLIEHIHSNITASLSWKVLSSIKSREIRHLQVLFNRSPFDKCFLELLTPFLKKLCMLHSKSRISPPWA